jgi:hypothetical protein
VGLEEKEGKQFFFEKTKKLLYYAARRRIEPRQRHKSFLVLFFKKERLAFP